MYKDEKYRTMINGKRTFLYSCYLNMMSRCYNPNTDKYSRYGGKGIKVEPFLQKRTNYVDYAHALLPKGKTIEDMKRLKMSLDRYPDENGDYKRGNLRWGTEKDQKLNRNLFKNNKSGYLGVYKQNGKWRAEIKIDGKKIHLGYFDFPEEAFDAYQKAYLEAHGPEQHEKMMKRQLERCKERGLKLIDPVTGVCYNFKKGAENE